MHSSFAHNLRRENYSGNFTVLFKPSYFSSDPTNFSRQCLAVVCGQWIPRYTSAPADQNPIRGREALGVASEQRTRSELEVNRALRHHIFTSRLREDHDYQTQSR